MYYSIHTEYILEQMSIRFSGHFLACRQRPVCIGLAYLNFLVDSLRTSALGVKGSQPIWRRSVHAHDGQEQSDSARAA